MSFLNKSKSIAFYSTLLFAAVLAIGCSGNSLGSDERVQRLKQTEIYVGEQRVSAEIVSTPDTRARGLMYRTSLGEDEGMLFVFPRPDIQSFWMKNTLIPLDLGYFDEDGLLIEIHSMEPDDGATFHTSSRPALYALEMNQGWFAKHDIRRYTRLRLPEAVVGQ